MPNTNKPSKASAATASGNSKQVVKHRRRFCRIEGCTRIVKSQGVCQRHGAKPKLCKIDGCTKQAQGNFDKMCKAHFKAMKRMTTPIPKVDTSAPPPDPEGYSVYDNVLPMSIAHVPAPGGSLNPLVAHLKAGFDQLKPPAWHRNEERRARGLRSIENPAAQLEGWERELVWMEILVLTGAPKASFRHLARAWGRDKGFHMVLAQFICERQGDVRRKSRKESKPKKKTKKKKVKKEDPAFNDNIFEDYGDDENVFADDVFNFTVEEFEVITSKWSNTFPEQVSSSTASDILAESPPSMHGEGEEAPPSQDDLVYGYHEQPQQQHSQSLQKEGIGHSEVHHHHQQQQQANELHLMLQNEHYASDQF